MITPQDILLTGQVAFVTGGANGIGKGIVEALANFGARVCIGDIDPESGKALAETLKSKGHDAHYVWCDVRERDTLKSAIDAAVATFGQLDIMVNNAGGSRQVAFMEMSERSRDRHVDFNLEALFAGCHHAATHMIGQKTPGSIINITSIEGLRAAPNYAVYAACKAGMINFTRSLSLELAEHGIRVNAIAPDIVMTDGLAGFDPETRSAKRIAERARYIPLGRDGDLDDCAGAAIFLASRLGSYMTGTTLSVDGGTYASSGWTRGKDSTWTLFPRED